MRAKHDTGWNVAPIPRPRAGAGAQTLEFGAVQPPSLAKPWGEFLAAQEWQAWGTLTVKYSDPTPEQLTRAWGKFVRWLVSEGNERVTWFVGHEVGALGRMHLHCLLGNLHPDTPRSALWRWWYQRYGRAEVKGYDPEKGAAHYVAKYVTKELAHYDLDFGGFTWQHGQLPLNLTGPRWKRTRKSGG